jgi:hypothetical protein
VSQRALCLFFLRNQPLRYNTRPSDKHHRWDKHVGEEIWCQVWGLDSLPVQLHRSSLRRFIIHSHFCRLHRSRYQSSECYLGDDIHYLIGDLATPSAGEPRPGTGRRSAHLHPPTRPDPQYRGHRRALIRSRSQAVISSSSQLHRFM